MKEEVKIRDKYTCQYCGEVVSGSNCHASHVIPVSQGNQFRFDGLNMKVLCYHHHINWWHKNPIKAAEWFKDKFPDRYNYLFNQPRVSTHYKIWWYEERLAESKERLKQSKYELT